MDGYGQSAIEAFQHLDENRRDYDERYGAGAYERDLKASRRAILTTSPSARTCTR